MNRILDVATSVVATLSRVAAGAQVGELGPRPEKTLVLYDFEGCPFCRKAREALSILDLQVEVRPCPKNGPRFRPELVKRGGKAMFPYLVDPNTGKEMYESDDIVRYLFETYGDGKLPLSLAAGPLTDIGSMLASAVRAGGGTRYRESQPPEQPLVLYSYEASPYCRLVREELSCLEIPYRLENVARGSARREELEQRAGKVMVPYLIDPNSGVEMFESADIIAYLRARYGSAKD